MPGRYRLHTYSQNYTARVQRFAFQIERAITTCAFSLRCGGNDTAIIAHRVNAHQSAEGFQLWRGKIISLSPRERAASGHTHTHTHTYDPINFPNERKPAVRQARAFFR